MVLRTKIAATIGPASADIDKIKKMINLGVSIFRINFSHGNLEEWKNYVDLVKEASNALDRYIALIGDLPGPSIRLGKLSEKVHLKRGESVRIVNADEVEGGKSKILPMPLKIFFEQISPRDIILMDDGRVQLLVEDVDKKEISARALSDAEITSRKAVVVRGKDLQLPTLSSRDIEAIKFCISNDFDYIGLSYVRNIRDVEELRSRLTSIGDRDIGIISKIETVEAVNNLVDIVDASDSLLVARGDLGMHFGLEQVPRLQEIITERCLERGKPVIVATQLLGSMMDNPIPTRSEIVDILTAIKDGVDVLMLTGETASGSYPIEAVEWLKKVVETYDSTVNPKKIKLAKNVDIRDKFAEGVTMLAESLGASIAIYTKTGKTALRISRNRPIVKLYACSGFSKTIRKMLILWGVQPMKINALEYREGLEEMINALKSSGEVKTGEIIVLTYGLRDEPMHLVKVVQVQ
ncbi:MAG: pyruvate kinase [Nitrososphaeria archaeon]|nr:pyruvate kinase [Nitrososphaeria archaeon]